MPEFEDDGVKIQPLHVYFPDGSAIKLTSEGTNVAFTCHVSFKSSKPLSFLKKIVFIDGEKNRYSKHPNSKFSG